MKVICGPTRRRAIVREVVLLLGQYPDGQFLVREVGAGQFEPFGGLELVDVHRRGGLVVPPGLQVQKRNGQLGVSTDAGQGIPHSGSVPSAAACGQNAAPV